MIANICCERKAAGNEAVAIQKIPALASGKLAPSRPQRIYRSEFTLPG
jgi:hypothetical protein